MLGIAAKGRRDVAAATDDVEFTKLLHILW